MAFLPLTQRVRWEKGLFILQFGLILNGTIIGCKFREHEAVPGEPVFHSNCGIGKRRTPAAVSERFAAWDTLCRGDALRSRCFAAAWPQTQYAPYPCRRSGGRPRAHLI